jgi:hypothetical protein
VPEPSGLGVEKGIEKFERYKSPAIDQIQAEMIQAAARTVSVL